MSTRLYFRDNAAPDAPPPGTLSAVLPNAAVTDGNYGPPYEDRSLLTVRGQTKPDSVISRNSIANTAHQDQYLCRFTTRRLQAQTIAANTWSWGMAFTETNAGANSELMLSVYVYRPTTRQVVGYIRDAHSVLGVEWGATIDGQVGTFGGSAVTCQDGDVICCEVWRHAASQATATAWLQALNYNAYIEVTDTMAAAPDTNPASMIETPQNLAFEAAYLPTSISGVFVELPGFVAPVMDGNGNLYVIIEGDEVSPQPAMWKSADGGKTWTEQDAANRPGTGGYEDLESLWMILSGTKLKTARQRSGLGAVHLAYFEFNTSEAAVNPDKWGLKEAIVSTAAADPPQESVSLIERSNGDLYVFYTAGTTPSSAVYARKPSGGAWSAATTIRSGCGQVTAIKAATDKIHIAVKEDTSTAYGGASNQIVHYSLSTADVLSAAEVVNDVSDVSSSEAAIVAPLVWYDDAGSEKVFICWLTTSGYLKGAFVTDDGTPEPEEFVTRRSVVVDAPDTNNLGPIATLAVDQDTKRIYCTYSNKNPFVVNVNPDGPGEGDLHLAVREHGVGWTVDERIRNNQRVMLMGSTVYTHSAANGGKKVLALFYDDSNGPHYDEEPLVPPSTPAYGFANMKGG